MKIKRMVSVVMATVVSLGLLSGCKSDGNNKKVELIWGTPWAKSAESDMVHEAFNKKLDELLPNTTVKFVEYADSNWSNLMGAGERFDIAWTGYTVDMQQSRDNGAYLELDELIEEYGPHIKLEMENYPAEYQSGRYNGTQYLIPNQQARVKHTLSFVVPASLWQYMDADAFIGALRESPYKMTEKQLQVLDQYLDKVYASEDYDTDTVGKYISSSLLKLFANRGYNAVGSVFMYNIADEDAEIINYYETEEYKLLCEYMAKWYQKGYISSEVTTTTSTRLPVLECEEENNWYATTLEGYGEDRGVVYNFDEFGEVQSYSILLTTPEERKSGIISFGSQMTYMCIPYTAEYPERAMQLLDLLRSPEGEELLTLLCYGFEEGSALAEEYGTYHYTVTEDGQAKGVDYLIQPTSQSKYGKASWTVGNCLLTYLTPDLLPGVDEYLLDYAKNVSPNIPKTKYYGFELNTKDLAIQMGNINSVLHEYDTQLQKGSAGAGWEKLYNEMISKLNALDLEKTKAEIVRQLDEYVASK